ncbi:MAG TPA: FAD-binding oxidoreductase, partial [Bacteroidota bacterium]
MEPYTELRRRLATTIPADRLLTDPLSTLALGTDASFYRLIPRLVVRLESERETLELLRQARQLRLPLTFRAAGTSLSGQAVSDSILALLSPPAWNAIRVSDDAALITLGPAVVGAAANRVLAPHDRKIGPDPASINAAMIGGIVANNASGMCCGTAQNSYRTLAGLRIILAD